MARPRRPVARRTRPIEVEADRFLAGWRLLPDLAPGDLLPLPVPEGERPIVIDVVRAADLVALTVEAYGCELVGGDQPVLRPLEGATARLVVRLPFQHTAERALYEGLAPVPDPAHPEQKPVQESPLHPADGENARPVPPIEMRPARGSRLVFSVPPGAEIAFSTTGLLAAVSRLPLLVHPLATPGTALSAPPPGIIFHLPGGLRGILANEGVFVTATSRKTGEPDPGTVSGLGILARDLRRTRAALAQNTGLAVRLGAAAANQEQPGPGFVRIGAGQFDIQPLVGIDGLARGPIIFRPPRRPRLSRPPTDQETAIEAPFRLIISPDAGGGWIHANDPVPATGAPGRIELWHTRLGRRTPNADGTLGPPVGDRIDNQRIVRALWARDRERYPDWANRPGLEHDDEPFRTSLDGADRNMLVRQTAESWLGETAPIAPDPVAARSLWLSSLGAWLDLHGQWTTLPYSQVSLPSILSWDHVAPLGRDQYVRVVYPGYLYPFGHRAALVKLTERKMKDAGPSVASLYQRKFLVVGEPVKRYDQLDFPLIEVRIDPLVTPTLSPDPGAAQDSFFWPMVGNQRFTFVLHCLDKESRPIRLVAPLLWVAEHYHGFANVDQGYSGDAGSKVPALGQKVAFADAVKSGDTTGEAAELRFAGAATLGGSRPHLADAQVTMPAVEQLSPVGPVTIAYTDTYKSKGFGGAANSGEVWAQVTSPAPTLSFGSPQAGSDKAGGFVQPDLPIRGLSRMSGTVGDVAGMETQKFDPAQFLSGALPKLFGLVPLGELVQAVTGDLLKAPNVVSEALDRVEGFLHDVDKAKQAVDDAVADALRQVQRVASKAAEQQQSAQQALTQAQQLQTTVTTAASQVVAAMGGLAHQSEAAVQAAVANPLNALRTAVTDIETVAPLLTPLVRNQLLALAKALRAVLDSADIVQDLFRFLNGLDPSSIQARFHFEWRPKLASWPSVDHPFLGITNPILEVPEDGFVLAVDGRASGKGQMGVDILAELRDFVLNLLPGTPLVRISFDHLSFHAGSTGKTDVDVVINEFEFLGILGFVETLRELIPFDGFSDPPYLDVSPSGLTAGFTLALPNIAIGVFALSNISLGADVQVPFLGKAVSVGFNFCSRERPFTLAVTFIGGGGWFLLRLSPDGLDVLELGLEAGATLSIDLGVASGSVSVMIGVYMRLEGKGGSLTAYFRIRGEVDVLGLISASIELYLELTYQFDTGKLTGKARLTVKIQVFVFSGSVTIECERQFAGSKGDPTFAELMAVQPDGTSQPWSDYCLAFAGA